MRSVAAQQSGHSAETSDWSNGERFDACILKSCVAGQSGRLEVRRTSKSGAEAAASARTMPMRVGACPSEPRSAARALSRAATSVGAVPYSAVAASRISMASCVRPSDARACATASQMHKMRAVRENDASDVRLAYHSPAHQPRLRQHLVRQARRASRTARPANQDAFQNLAIRLSTRWLVSAAPQPVAWHL